MEHLNHRMDWPEFDPGFRDQRPTTTRRGQRKAVYSMKKDFIRLVFISHFRHLKIEASYIAKIVYSPIILIHYIRREFSLIMLVISWSMAARSKAWACGRSIAGIAGSNSAEGWIFVACVFCVGSSLFDEQITRAKKSCRACVCLTLWDLEIWKQWDPCPSWATAPQKKKYSWLQRLDDKRTSRLWKMC
jgi:hypothetical protein